MNIFMEKFIENVKNDNGEPILFYGDNEGLTYSRINELSGKVLCFLRSNNIGREDFILIDLPRGVEPIICMIGIWKAGAAFVVVEENYAPERVQFIREDCKCKCEIDSKVWGEILKTDPSDDIASPDEHDVAYATYTSGTTGKPKGILQEYGSLRQCIESMSYDGKPVFYTGLRLAVIPPLNFVAAVLEMIIVFAIPRFRFYIVPYSIIKNPVLLMQFWVRNRISCIFMTPSYVRMFNLKDEPFLKVLIVSSEPSDNVFDDNVDMYNFYAMSESGFIIAVFKIDKPYSPCPIGKPEFDLDVKLIDEEGNETFEQGDMCFKNDFVRGYTTGSSKDGENDDGYCHTGDVARRLPDGNYVIVGRSNDMIKINGNAIRPSEIEEAVKKVLGIKWVVAKGFVDKDSAYICVYYTEDVNIDADTTRERLLKYLPYYMIPNYYVKIDNIPHNANGKTDRTALPRPQVKAQDKAYVAPANEIEEKICKAFASVLNREKVGADDDFYEMGGDSLNSIKVIVECGLSGLTVSDIFRERTARKIAERYIASHVDEDAQEALNKEAMNAPHPLLVEQKYMFNYQLYTPKSTMYNLFFMLKLGKDGTDINRFADAVDLAISNHASLLTEFSFDEDGRIVQRYNPEFAEKISAEKISEEGFEKIKDDLVQPYKLIGSRMYRCRMFETPENVYLYFDVHHLVFDGTSFKILIADIESAYMGIQLKRDYYYLVLKKREELPGTDIYKKAQSYYLSKYENEDWTCLPGFDHITRENKVDEISALAEATSDKVQSIRRNLKITVNEFFITAAALTLAIYNDRYNIKIGWIYNGRDDIISTTTAGPLFRDLPVAFRFHDDTLLKDIFSSAGLQVKKGIENSCYPYEDMDAQVVEEDCISVLYQQDIREVNTAYGTEVEQIDIRQNYAAAQNILDIQILDGEDGFQIVFDYSTGRYKRESMEKFMDMFLDVLEYIADNESKDGITFRDVRDAIED